MQWNRKLWGIQFSSKLAKPMLLGSLWTTPMPRSQYDGEPTRALLFCTREQARAWCKNKMLEYKKQNGVCMDWRFIPVRVIENVSKTPNV